MTINNNATPEIRETWKALLGANGWPFDFDEVVAPRLTRFLDVVTGHTAEARIRLDMAYRCLRYGDPEGP